MEICKAPILRIIIIIIIVVVVVVVVVIAICKAPILRLKAPNKHNITHVMYMEMEHATSNEQKPTHDTDTPPTKQAHNVRDS